MKKNKFFAVSVFAVKIIFTLCAMMWVVFRVDWNYFIRQVPDLNYILAVSGFFLFAAFVIPSAARWVVTARICGFNLSYKNSVYNYFVSAFFGAFLPKHGCDFVRGFLVVRQLNVSFGKSMGSVLIERVCGFFVAFSICLFGLVISAKEYPALKGMIIPLSVMIIVFILAVILSFNGRFRKIVIKFFSFMRIDPAVKFFNDIFLSIDLFKVNRNLMLFIVLMSLLNQFTTIFSGVFLAFAIPGFDAPLISFFVVTTVVFFTFIIPSIGGYGVTQASIVIVFAMYGVDQHCAAVYSILRLIFSLMVSLIGGILFLVGKPFKMKDVLKENP